LQPEPALPSPAKDFESLAFPSRVDLVAKADWPALGQKQTIKCPVPQADTTGLLFHPVVRHPEIAQTMGF
jgi:hypothetical protein